MESETNHQDRITRVTSAVIPDALEDRTTWGFCGYAPLDRRASGGIVAETQHGTCLSCFYPVPTHRLIDGICPDCRGDFDRVTSTEVNTEKRLTAKTIVKACAACGTEKPILDLDDEGCCEGGCK